jgi:hypothetical protein
VINPGVSFTLNQAGTETRFFTYFVV